MFLISGLGSTSLSRTPVRYRRQPMVEGLTDRQRQTLEYIATTVAERGYPPSVREIGEAMGLASSSTVHSHMQALQRKGYLRIDPTKPRAIELLFDPETGLAAERRPSRSVPLVG